MTTAGKKRGPKGPWKYATPPVILMCSRCKEEKPVSEFSPAPSAPSGYDCYCRPCQAWKTRHLNWTRKIRRYGVESFRPLVARAQQIAAEMQQLLEEYLIERKLR